MDAFPQTSPDEMLAIEMADCLSAHDGLEAGVKDGRQFSCEDDLILGAEASLYATGMVRLTVSEYMRSLKKYIEEPPLTLKEPLDLPSVQPTSIPELMKHMEADPVELLLDLGFGKEEPDITTRIPSRFINGISLSKGINIRVFLEAQKQRISIENPNLYGRFRQLEVLDQVTSAFSSLLCELNTSQQLSDLEEKEKPANADDSKLVKRRRVCQLLRKASRQQTLMHQESVMGTGNLDPIKCIDQALTPKKPERGKLVRKTKKRISENSKLDLLTEEQTVNEDRTENSYGPSGNLKGKIPVSAHTAIKSPLLSSEIPVKDRARKKSTLFLTKTLKRASGLHEHPMDSFEMEEIHSFEEESLRGSNNTSETEMKRTNSCQSDSSGFLEEPLEPIIMQNTLLPENMSISSDSTDSQSTLLSGMDSVYQENKQDLNGSTDNMAIEDSKSTLKAPNPNLQDRHLRDKHTIILSERCRNESLYYSLELPPDSCSNECSPLGEDQQRTNIGKDEPNGDNRNNLDTSSHIYHPDADQLFYRVHTFQENNILLDENSENEGGDYVQQDMTENMETVEENGSESNSGPPVESSLETSASLFCGPLEKGTGEGASVLSESHNSDYASAGCPASFPGMSENVTQSVRQKRGIQEITASDLSPAQEKDPNETSKITTHFYKSVTIQMSSDLTSSLQSSPSIDFLTKDYSCEIPRMSSENCEDEQVKPFGPEAVERSKKLKVKEVSSQTNNEFCARNFCLLHRHGTLTKSTSFDTGIFDYSKPLQTHAPSGCATKSYHGCHCCCCCCHYCCSLCGFPIPAGSTCSMPCCSNYTSMELELLRTLKALQDSLMNISPCTVLEMETMKKSCQKFREQLVETEQLLFEQQTLLPTELTYEGREEMRRLQVLRRAVHREVAELECQLEDRTRQTREGILMQLNQLLEEQAKLHSELEVIDWREEGAAQSQHTSSSTLKTTPYPQSLATECSVSVSQQEDMQPTSMDSKETKTPNPQKKGDFSAFLRNLKKHFRHSFASENAE